MVGYRLVRGAHGPASVFFASKAAAVVAASALLVSIGAVAAVAGDPPPPPAQDWTRTETRDDCANHDPLRIPLFGDTHVHTKYSADAVLARTRNDPYQAYDFAKGLPIGLPPFDSGGNPLRHATIEEPLDFTAVTDHAEGFGEAVICLNDVAPGYDDPLCQSLRSTLTATYHPTNDLPTAFIQFFIALNGPSSNPSLPEPSRFEGICGPAPDYADCVGPAGQAGIVWQATKDAAEANYDRTSACSFTTFVAYEWSGNTDGNNLHRNIIFRNADVPALPITYYEQWRPEGLWAELQSQCLDASTNCDVLAIPHNSNIARAGMFSPRDSYGNLITAGEAATRASFEPLMELTQVKGDSECRDGLLGTTDELCSFEKLSRTTLIGTSNWDQPFSQYAYARGALKLGLSIERRTGVNPFALGFVGATDTHNGTPGAVSELDYGHIGFSGIADSEPAFILAEGTAPSKIQSNPGGLSVVWAEENSRDAIFSAMRRRETYSTSGTRPIVRTFAGRYPLDLCDDPNFVAEGYDKGVPMGGDIGPVLGKKSPHFAIRADMDNGAPGRPGTPLQRIQVVKIWVKDATSDPEEEVFDVAGSADNGAGVDPATCEETLPAGETPSTSLCTVWSDPHFKPDQNALYYVRVLENPVCRWSKRLCNDLKTCSITLKSCALDPTRTCTTNTDCTSAASSAPGVTSGSSNTCSVNYPVVCTSDVDCSNQGAGTCGTTPAVVDCSNPASLPPAAAECCDPNIPQTIQERAVTSPIFYHPNRMGIGKARVAFGDTAGTDTLQLGLFIGSSPSDLDPAMNDLHLTLRGDSTVWDALIPAGTMTVKKAGASYSYSVETGGIAGITSLQVKISSKGVAKITVKTGGIDLSALTRASQTLSLDLVSGSYSSTSVRQWSYKDPNLSPVL